MMGYFVFDEHLNSAPYAQRELALWDGKRG